MIIHLRAGNQATRSPARRCRTVRPRAAAARWVRDCGCAHLRPAVQHQLFIFVAPSRATSGGDRPAMRYDLVLRSRQTVLPEGIRPAAVAVSGPVITAVAGYGEPLEAARGAD